MKPRIFWSALAIATVLTTPIQAQAGFDEGLEAYQNQDYKTAYSEWLSLAEQGDPDAQYHLSGLYDAGLGVMKDYNQRLIWITKAAEQGHAQAQYALAFIYERGENVKKDDKQALKWFTKAAIQGYSNAQLNLGYNYANGKGVKKDDQQAFAWYSKAAKQGVTAAQYIIGSMYANGVGVKKDDNQAFAWYTKAAAKNHVRAKAEIEKRNKILSCQKNTATKLFDLAITCASRDDLMLAIKKAGGAIKQEDKNFFADIYYSSRILDGSSELTIHYTPLFFAKAEYMFPSQTSPLKVDSLENMLTSKYGHPAYTQNNSYGGTFDRWKLDDGIKVELYRGRTTTPIYLSYTYPKNKRVMDDEITRVRNVIEAQKAQTQSSNY